MQRVLLLLLFIGKALRAAAFLPWPLTTARGLRRLGSSSSSSSSGSDEAPLPLEEELYAEVVATEKHFFETRQKQLETKAAPLAEVLGAKREQVVPLAERLNAADANVSQLAAEFGISEQRLQQVKLQSGLQRLAEKTRVPSARGGFGPSQITNSSNTEEQLWLDMLEKEPGYQANSWKLKQRLFQGAPASFDDEGRPSETAASADAPTLAEGRQRAASLLFDQVRSALAEAAAATDEAAVTCPACGRPCPAAELSRWGLCGICRADQLAKPDPELRRGAAAAPGFRSASSPPPPSGGFKGSGATAMQPGTARSQQQMTISQRRAGAASASASAAQTSWSDSPPPGSDYGAQSSGAATVQTRAQAPQRAAASGPISSRPKPASLLPPMTPSFGSGSPARPAQAPQREEQPQQQQRPPSTAVAAAATAVAPAAVAAAAPALPAPTNASARANEPLRRARKEEEAPRTINAAADRGLGVDADVGGRVAALEQQVRDLEAEVRALAHQLRQQKAATTAVQAQMKSGRRRYAEALDAGREEGGKSPADGEAGKSEVRRAFSSSRRRSGDGGDARAARALPGKDWMLDVRPPKQAQEADTKENG